MQIVSGSRDKTIKLWNTLGECKYTIGEPDGHTEWVSCVRFSPVVNNPLIVSAGWDRQVKARARAGRARHVRAHLGPPFQGARMWPGLPVCAVRPSRARALGAGSTPGRTGAATPSHCLPPCASAQVLSVNIL